MSATAIRDALVAQLRLVEPGAKPHLGEIRRAIAAELGVCSNADLTSAVQALRFQGKLHWERLELAPSMMIESSTAGLTAAEPTEGAGESPDRNTARTPSVDTCEDLETPPQAEDGTAGAPVEPSSNTSSREDEAADGGNTPPPQNYPSEVNDVAGPAPAGSMTQRAGLHGAMTRAAARPVPAPRHEPEIARQVREEVSSTVARRGRATSTGTVRLPLELRRYGVPDLTLSEAIGTMLSDDPRAIMRAVSRKHPDLWRRCILLGRRLKLSPMQTLYQALECGVAAIEADTPVTADAA